MLKHGTNGCTDWRLREIVDNMPLGAVVYSHDSDYLMCNKAAMELFGLDESDMPINRWFSEFSPEYQTDGKLTSEKKDETVAAAFRDGKTNFEWMHKSAKGEEIPTDVTLVRVEREDGTDFVAFIRDLREFNVIRENERVTTQRLMAMVDSAPMACTIVDENLKVLDVNKEIANLLGLPDKQLYLDRQMDFSPLYQPDGQPSYPKMIEKLKNAFESGRDHFEWMHNTLDGTMVPCEVFLERVNLDGRNFLTVYKRDLRELKNTISLMEKLEEMAFSDELTKLSTRHYFMETASNELAESIETDSPYHLLMVDIDFFKEVNDKYGHTVGDEVLKLIALRMRQACRRSTLIARFGGEEFIVTLPNIDLDEAKKVAWRIRQAMNDAPFQVSGHEITVTVSLGLASRTSHGDTLSELIERADSALYSAKDAGKNTVVVSL